jgi:hypothetical protein
MRSDADKLPRMLRMCLPLCLLALSGCGQSDTEPGPGGVTVGEARALDQAAAMLDQRRPPAEALQPADPKLPQDQESEEAGE